MGKMSLYSMVFISMYLVGCANKLIHPQTMQVVDQFVDIHKKANENSDIFYVAERWEMITLLEYKSGFFFVLTESGLQGWVSEMDIMKTQNSDGQTIDKIEHGVISF